MNHDPRFLRVRIRRLVPLLAEAGFGPARLAATARHFALAADAVDERASRLIARAVSHDGLAVAQLDRDLLAGEPAAIRSRVVARLLLAIGGEPYPPRRERLPALAEAIVGHPGGRFKRTLAGVVAEWRDGAFLFYREVGRQKLPAHVAAAAYSGIWDNRFRIDIAEDAPPGLTLGALGEAGRRSIGASSAVAPPDALAALPAMRAGATDHRRAAACLSRPRRRRFHGVGPLDPGRAIRPTAALSRLRRLTAKHSLRRNFSMIGSDCLIGIRCRRSYLYCRSASRDDGEGGRVGGRRGISRK